MKRCCCVLLCVSLWIGLTAFPGEAHRVSLFAYFEGNTLVGEVYFSAGNPAKGVPVTVASGDVLLAQGNTDEEGNFSLSLDAIPPEGVLVTVKAGMGHQAEQVVQPDFVEEKPLPAEEKKDSIREEKDLQNSDVSSEIVRKILREELLPLKSILLSLQKKQEEPGIPEIMGGIGYIFGLVGMYMWYRGGRKRG